MVALGLIVCVAGCITVGPDYEEPETTVPDQWYAAATKGVEQGDAPLQTWWAVFEDPLLNDIIRRATEANLNLEAAVYRLQEARALRGVIEELMLDLMYDLPDQAEENAVYQITADMVNGDVKPSLFAARKVKKESA